MIILGIICCYLSLAISLSKTMNFLVDLSNSVIKGVKGDDSFIDNSELVVSWGLTLLGFMFKDIIWL